MSRALGAFDVLQPFLSPRPFSSAPAIALEGVASAALLLVSGRLSAGVPVQSLLLASLLPILKVVCLAALGCALAKFKVLKASTRHDLSKIIFYVFLPCFIFVHLGTTVTLAGLLKWWFIPVNVLLSSAVGCGLGLAVSWLFAVPADLVALTTAMVGIGNQGSIPITLMSALCRDSHSPFGNPQSCERDATAYVALGIWVNAVLVWGVVYPMLAPPKTGNDPLHCQRLAYSKLQSGLGRSEQKSSDSETFVLDRQLCSHRCPFVDVSARWQRRGSEGCHWSGARPIKSCHELVIPLLRTQLYEMQDSSVGTHPEDGRSPQPPVAEIVSGEVQHSLPASLEHCYRVRGSPAEGTLQMQRNTEAVGHGSRKSNKHPAIPTRIEGPVGLSTVPGAPALYFAIGWRFWSTFQSLLRPPIIAAFLAVICGIIPNAQTLLFKPDGVMHWIVDVATISGGAYIPCIFMVIGADMLPTVHGNMAESNLSSSAVVAIVLARMMLLPILGTAIVLNAHTVGFIPTQDRLLTLVLLLQYTSPAPVEIGTCSSLHNHGVRQTSLLLMYQHLAGVCSLTGSLFCYLLILFR